MNTAQRFGVALAMAVCGLDLCAAPAVNFDLPSTEGAHRTFSQIAGAKATVLVFLGIDCPISNRYSPLLERLRAAYQPKGVHFLAVFSGPGQAIETVRAHLREFNLGMAGLLDSGDTLARQTGAKVTPEAVIVSPAGQVLYRGRIDDRYVDWGKTRSEPTVNDLRDALDQIVAGRPVAHPATRALGCAITGLAS